MDGFQRWVDAHMDSLLDHFAGKRNWLEHSPVGHADLPRLLKSGINLQVLAHFVEPTGNPDRSLRSLLRLLASSRQLLSDERVLLIETNGDLDQIEVGRQIGVIFGLEGCECVGEHVEIFLCLYDLGIRLLSLVWNERNALADGAMFNQQAGLTPAGREMVSLANRLGVVIDVSHLNEPAFWQVLSESSSPVVASHSNAAACCQHPRNLTDEQIKALAASGGVIGINFYPRFLNGTDRADIHDVLRHIDHIVNLVGIEHVGIGSDFDGIPCTPIGLSDVQELPQLASALRNIAGYSEEDMKKIMGGNFWRLFADVLPN